MINLILHLERVVECSPLAGYSEHQWGRFQTWIELTDRKQEMFGALMIPDVNNGLGGECDSDEDDLSILPIALFT